MGWLSPPLSIALENSGNMATTSSSYSPATQNCDRVAGVVSGDLVPFTRWWVLDLRACLSVLLDRVDLLAARVRDLKEHRCGKPDQDDQQSVDTASEEAEAVSESGGNNVKDGYSFYEDDEGKHAKCFQCGKIWSPRPSGLVAHRKKCIGQRQAVSTMAPKQNAATKRRTSFGQDAELHGEVDEWMLDSGDDDSLAGSLALHRSKRLNDGNMGCDATVRACTASIEKMQAMVAALQEKIDEDALRVEKPPKYVRATATSVRTSGQSLIWIADSSSGFVKFLPSGFIQFPRAGVFELTMVLKHNSSGGTSFKLMQGAKVLEATTSHTSGADFQATPMHYVLTVTSSGAALLVVYTGNHQAQCGSYVTIRKLS